MKISQGAIAALEAGPRSSTERFEWDDKLAGFGLRIRPSGAISYVAQWKLKGQQRRHSLGRHPKITAEQARKRAFALLNQVAQGSDPVEALEADRASITVEQFARDYYLPALAAGKVKRKGKVKKASTAALDRGRIRNHIVKLLGKRRLVDLTARDVRRFMADVEAGKTAGGSGNRAVTGGESAARRVVGLLGGMMSFAVNKGLLDHNPVRDIERGSDNVRDRVLTADELARIGAELAAEGEIAGRIIRFIAMSGFRRSEALNLRRSDVDPAAGTVRLRDSKTGPQVRVVGRAALDVLAAVPVRATIDPDPYIFWSANRPGLPYANFALGFGRACARAGVENASVHTLRHSYATTASQLGFNLFIVAALLGHSAGGLGVTGQYVSHGAADPTLRLAADRIAAEIAARLDGRTADVVTLAPRLAAPITG